MTVADAKRARYGLRKPSPIGSIVAAATPITVFIHSAGRTLNVRKIHITNRNAAATVVQIGQGLAGAFVQAIPSYYAVGGGMDLEITEDQIPDVEFTGDVTAQASVAAAAPNDVQIQVEVEEYQGPNG